MELLQVPHIPNYLVDTKNNVVYKMKYGRLLPVNMRTKYKSFTINVEGKTIGTTLYRMLYGAINQIDITKIPKGLCITMENGKLVVVERSYIVNKTNVSKKKAKERIEQIKKNMGMIEEYYKGNCAPIITYLNKLENSLRYHFILVRGYSQQRSEIIVGNAVNKYLDNLKKGDISFAIRANVLRLAYNESKNP